MKNSHEKTVANGLKQPYEKPIMQVYEMEVENSILTGMASGMHGWEARVNDTCNSFEDSFPNLKA